MNDLGNVYIGGWDSNTTGYNKEYNIQLSNIKVNIYNGVIDYIPFLS